MTRKDHVGDRTALRSRFQFQNHARFPGLQRGRRIVSNLAYGARHRMVATLAFKTQVFSRSRRHSQETSRQSNSRPVDFI
jgi:hypothetical protein